jgi:hypothetical protein
MRPSGRSDKSGHLPDKRISYANAGGRPDGIENAQRHRMNNRRLLSSLSILVTIACGQPPERPPAGTRTVIVSYADTHITRQGLVENKPDLSGIELAVHIPDPDGGFDVVSITDDDDDGLLEIRDVPSGTYYLQVGSFYLVSSEGSIDLSEILLGRPDAVASMASPTDLVFDLEGLIPWQSDDDLQVIAPDVGEAYMFADGSLRSSPSTGTTRLDGARLDWFRRNLVRGTSEGDRLSVAQLISTQSPAGWNYRRLERFFEADPFEQNDGAESRIGGSFAPVALDSTVPLDWRKSQFAAFGSDVHPRAEPAYEQLTVSVLPRASQFGLYAAGPDLMYMLHKPNASDINDTFAFGNPYPSSWDKFVVAASRFRVEYSIGDASPAAIYGGFRSEASLSEIAGKPIRPSLTTVRNIRVNGRSADVDLSGVTPTPTLSWEAPSVGPAAGYVVYAIRLADLAGETDLETHASFITDSTELRVPPGALDPYGVYVFVIGAVQRPGKSLSSAPLRSAPLLAYTEALTEKVSP